MKGYKFLIGLLLLTIQLAANQLIISAYMLKHLTKETANQCVTSLDTLNGEQ